MSRPTIRNATVADAPGLVPLLADLGYPEQAATVERRLRHLLATDATGRVLIAELGSDIVGFATLHCTPTLHRPTPVGRITGIAVSAAGRGHGAGRLLVEAAEAYFAGLGLARIEVTSGPTHEAAYGFYRHLGFADQGLRFGKPLAR